MSCAGSVRGAEKWGEEVGTAVGPVSEHWLSPLCHWKASVFSAAKHSGGNIITALKSLEGG